MPRKRFMEATEVGRNLEKYVLGDKQSRADGVITPETH